MCLIAFKVNRHLRLNILYKLRIECYPKYYFDYQTIGGIMKKRITIVSSVVLMFCLVLWGAGEYFFAQAIKIGPKSFIDSEASDVWREANEWFATTDLETWKITSDNGLLLSATYIAATEATNSTIFVAHGYGNSTATMTQYIKMFHDAGYNVLAADARGHGESEGSYIGFGWPERRDVVQWTQEIVNRLGSQQQIGLYGLSMGASTVMMASGESDLPSNVKVIVEDCGYSSVDAELSFQLSDMYSLPAFPMIPVTSLLTEVKVGYSFYEASAINQLNNNVKPILFIHGDADTFVPTSMVYELFEATRGPKELWIVEDTDHADSYENKGFEYAQRVVQFMDAHIEKAHE